MRRRVALALAGAAVVLLAACSAAPAAPDSAPAATGEELVARAKQEGQVVWYTGNLLGFT